MALEVEISCVIATWIHPVLSQTMERVTASSSKEKGSGEDCAALNPWQDFDNYILSHCNPYCCSDSEALACLHGLFLHPVNSSLHHHSSFFQSLTHFSSLNCKECLKNKQISWLGWLGETIESGRSWRPASGSGMFTCTGLLTFFPHMQDIGKLAFFLFLPFPDRAIQQGWRMGRSFISSPHSPSEERGR